LNVAKIVFFDFSEIQNIKLCGNFVYSEPVLFIKIYPKQETLTYFEVIYSPYSALGQILFNCKAKSVYGRIPIVVKYFKVFY